MSKEDREELSREERRKRWKDESRRQARASAEFLSDFLRREADKEQAEKSAAEKEAQARRATQGTLVSAAAKLEQEANAREEAKIKEEEDRLKPPVGVGIGITTNPPYRVTDVIQGGAAAMSGDINVGDYMLWVGGIDITNKPFHEVKALILGPAGSKLKLKMDRRSPSGEHSVFNTTITRCVPQSVEPADHSRNRLSRPATQQSDHFTLVHVPVPQPSPFPSRPPPSLNMPARSPAPLHPIFDAP